MVTLTNHGKKGHIISKLYSHTYKKNHIIVNYKVTLTYQGIKGHIIFELHDHIDNHS